MDKAARSVLVTGGSRGLGLAICQTLAAAGYDVVAVARNKHKNLAAAIAQAGSAGQGSLHFVPFDLGRIDEIPELARQVRRDFGPMFGLVNNAALEHHGALATMHNTKLEEQVRINTLSPIVLTKYVMRGMMSAGTGRIVNVCFDHRRDRLQRACGLCGNQSVDGGLHPLAGARGRPARDQRQRGLARLSCDRHDAGDGGRSP